MQTDSQRCTIHNLRNNSQEQKKEWLNIADRIICPNLPEKNHVMFTYGFFNRATCKNGLSLCRMQSRHNYSIVFMIIYPTVVFKTSFKCLQCIIASETIMCIYDVFICLLLIRYCAFTKPNKCTINGQ